MQNTMKPKALHLTMPTSPELKDAFEKVFVECCNQRGETVSRTQLVRRIVVSLVCLFSCLFGMITITFTPRFSVGLAIYPDSAKRLIVSLPIYFFFSFLLTVWNHTEKKFVASSDASRLTWSWYPHKASGILCLSRHVSVSHLVATDREYSDSGKSASITLNATDFLDSTGHIKQDVINSSVRQLFNQVSPMKTDQNILPIMEDGEPSFLPLPDSPTPYQYPVRIQHVRKIRAVAPPINEVEAIVPDKPLPIVPPTWADIPLPSLYDEPSIHEQFVARPAPDYIRGATGCSPPVRPSLILPRLEPEPEVVVLPERARPDDVALLRLHMAKQLTV